MTTLVNSVRRVLARSTPSKRPVETPDHVVEEMDKTDSPRRALTQDLFRKRPQRPSPNKSKVAPEVKDQDVQNKLEEGRKWKKDVIKKKDAEKKKHDEHLQEKLDAKTKGKKLETKVKDSPIAHIAMAAQVGDSLKRDEDESDGLSGRRSTSEADVQTCESFAWVSPDGDTVKKEEKEEEPVTENISASRAKLKLLQRKEFVECGRQNWPRIWIAVDEEKGTVAFTGPQAQVNEAVASLQTQLEAMVEITSAEDPSVVGLIQLKETHEHIKTRVDDLGANVTWDVLDGKELAICADTKADVDQALDTIRSELLHREVAIEDHQDVLVGVDQWNALLDDLQEQYRGLLLPIAVHHVEDEAEESRVEGEESMLAKEALEAGNETATVGKEDSGAKTEDADVEKEGSEVEKDTSNLEEEVSGLNEGHTEVESEVAKPEGPEDVSITDVKALEQSQQEIECEGKKSVLKIHIAAVRHVMDEVETELRHFLENFSWERALPLPAGLARVLYKGLQMDVRRIEKDCGVTMETTGHGVQTKLMVTGQSKAQRDAEKRLQELQSKVYCREHKVCRPGLAKYFLSEIGLEYLGRMETKYRLAVHPELGEPDLDAVTMPTVKSTRAKPKHPLCDMYRSTDEVTELVTVEGVRVRLVPGDITALQTDAILNSTTTRLNLNAGALSAAILKAAGPEVRKDCYRVTPWFGLREGQVVHTPGRALPCQHILHASGISYIKNKARSERALRLVLKNSLELAEELGCKSVAFPPFGCGNLKMPPSTVARILLEQVASYSLLSNKSPKIKDVRIVVRPEDNGEWQALTSEFTELSSTPRARGHVMSDGRRRRHHQDFPSLLEGYMSSLPRSVEGVPLGGAAGGQAVHPASTVIFHLYSLSEDTLDLVQEAIDERCKTETQTFTIGDEKDKKDLMEKIKTLQPEQVKMLEEVGLTYSVLVTVDQSRDQGVVRLQGLENDIVYVVEQVDRFLQEVHKLDAAAKLTTTAQWQYQTDDTYRSYSQEINRLLENAFLSKQESVEWVEKNEEGASVTYTVNFADMMECEKDNASNSVPIRRNTDDVTG